jgi:hypothetical protein
MSLLSSSLSAPLQLHQRVQVVDRDSPWHQRVGKVSGMDPCACTVELLLENEWYLPARRLRSSLTDTLSVPDNGESQGGSDCVTGVTSSLAATHLCANGYMTDDLSTSTAAASSLSDFELICVPRSVISTTVPGRDIHRMWHVLERNWVDEDQLVSANRQFDNLCLYASPEALFIKLARLLTDVVTDANKSKYAKAYFNGQWQLFCASDWVFPIVF